MVVIFSVEIVSIWRDHQHSSCQTPAARGRRSIARPKIAYSAPESERIRILARQEFFPRPPETPWLGGDP
jgi:hypothetical protein